MLKSHEPINFMLCVILICIHFLGSVRKTILSSLIIRVLISKIVLKNFYIPHVWIRSDACSQI